MKVIFLDFDGVLNSETSFLYEHNRRNRHHEQNVSGPVNETLSLHCCAAFQEVLFRYPEANIVISSTWRTTLDIGWLQAKLIQYNVDGSRVIGTTPIDPNVNRGEEISLWLKKHPEVLHYVIIDDNDDGISNIHGKDRFVQTDWERGMGLNHANELIFKLSAKNQKLVEERLKEERIAKEKILLEVLKEHYGSLDGAVETVDQYKAMLRQIQQIVSKV